MYMYLLWHTHEFEDGSEDSKLIGVYATNELAMSARARSKLLLGFQDHPNGFDISTYEVNEDHWTEGYVTVTDDD
jgi:hypothetical protein